MPVDVGFTDRSIGPDSPESVRQRDPSSPETLDPDIALWQQVLVSIWPFTGAPTVGTFPKGWMGIDNTSSVYVCTAGGTPGTWSLLSGGGGSSGGTIPGMVNDGVTDNYTTLVNYVNAFVAANPGGGITPQKVPLGRCAISQTFVPPAGVILDGYGNAVMGGTFNPNASGSWLCPTASFTGSQVVRLDNEWSGVRNLNIDAGTTVFSAIQVNAADCQFDGCSALRGAASLNGITFDSTTNAQRLCLSGPWDIRCFVTDSTVTALQALGGDWIAKGGRVTHGGKVINVLGGQWLGVHFTHSSASGAVSALSNVHDSGGSIYSGCYFDSCSADATCLLNLDGTNSSCFFGCRYYQNTAGVTGIPVVLGAGRSGGAGTVIVGGWVKVGGATGSSFTAFFEPSTGVPNYDIVTGVMSEQSFTVSFFAPGVGQALPTGASANNNNGVFVGNVPVKAPSTPAFTANNYIVQPTDMGSSLQASNGSTPATMTVEAFSSGATTLDVPVGSEFEIVQTGAAAGKISIVAATGVTIQSSVAGGFVSGTTGCRTQFSKITLTKTATNTWVLSGDAA